MLIGTKISLSDVLSVGLAACICAVASITVPGLLVKTYRNVRAEQLFQEGRKAFDNRDFKLASSIWQQTYLYQKSNPSLLLRLSETANNLGVALAKQGLDREASEKLNESIRIRKRFCCDDGVATSLYQLAKISIKEGNIRQARVYIGESASIYAKTLGASAPDTFRAKKLLSSLG